MASAPGKIGYTVPAMPTINEMITRDQPKMSKPFSSLQYIFLNNFGNAMLIVRQRNDVRRFFHSILRITHSNAKSSIANSGNVVQAVSNCNDLRHVNTHDFAKLAQR